MSLFQDNPTPESLLKGVFLEGCTVKKQAKRKIIH